MFAKLKRALRPLDTSEFDRAIAAANAGHRAVQVRARALRMDVSCGDPEEVMRRLGSAIVCNLCSSPQSTHQGGKAWDSQRGWTRPRSNT